MCLWVDRSKAHAACCRTIAIQKWAYDSMLIHYLFKEHFLVLESSCLTLCRAKRQHKRSESPVFGTVRRLAMGDTSSFCVSRLAAVRLTISLENFIICGGCVILCFSKSSLNNEMNYNVILPHHCKGLKSLLWYFKSFILHLEIMILFWTHNLRVTRPWMLVPASPHHTCGSQFVMLSWQVSAEISSNEGFLTPDANLRWEWKSRYKYAERQIYSSS